MKNRYYHGVAGGIPFWQEEAVLNESLRVLKLIFKYKAIYCRSILKKLKIEVNDCKEAVYNSDDYISICMDNPPDEDWEPYEMRNLESSFWVYAKQKIAIEFKPLIEQECVFRKLPYKHLPAERQIYQSIDISNFNRILIGLENNELIDKAIIEISKICEPYQIPVMTFREVEYLENNQKRLRR